MPRTLSNWIDAYTECTIHLAVPERFNFWVAASVIAGVSRRNVWMTSDNIKTFPNTYILLVAPPATSKDTALNIGMSILKRTPCVCFDVSAASWQGFTSFLTQNISGVTVKVSELSMFLDLTNQEQLDTLTVLWHNYEMTRKRSNSYETIKPCINLIGCTTPKWLEKNMSLQFVQSGLASRIIFVYANKNYKNIAFPQVKLSEDHEILIQDLNRIAGLTGEFVLTKEATTWKNVWYEKHCNKLEKINKNYLRLFLTRKQTHLYKLGMILSMSRGDDMLITVEDLSRAEQHLNEIEKDLPKTFQKAE